MYERTISVFTFSKSYAMTGLRLGYVAVTDAQLRERMKKALFYTCSNVTSVVQFGGIGALEGPQDCVAAFRAGAARRARSVLRGDSRACRRRAVRRRRREGRSTRSCAIDPRWRPRADSAGVAVVGDGRASDFAAGGSGACPASDFGATGEGYMRFCFARDRRELTGALASMRELFAGASSAFVE